MAGHSKWETTKRQKAVADAKRGAIFTKLGNLITIAVRDKGADPGVNFSLRMAIDKAKQANVPKENIERAIKRGLGEIEGQVLEELVYEGQGPAGSQFIINCLTDNRNRTASVLRHLFSKMGGSLTTVNWNFDQLGVVQILNSEITDKLADWDNFVLDLIDQGAQEINQEDEGVVIYTKPNELSIIKDFLEKQAIATEVAELQQVAKDKITVDNPDDRVKLDKFIEGIEDCEDVSSFFTNAEWD